MKDFNHLKRLDELSEIGKGLHNKGISEYKNRRWNLKSKEYADFVQWRTSCLNVIKIIVGEKNYFYDSFPKVVPNIRNNAFLQEIVKGVGILRSLNEELKRGYITKLNLLISRDILHSISEEAKALLTAGYTEAAAVYCRVILETSLKKLCEKNDLGYDKRASINQLNEILRQEKILNLIEWRQIQAWADIGNAAAHGYFSEYDEKQVEMMILGIDEFKTRLLV